MLQDFEKKYSNQPKATAKIDKPIPPKSGKFPNANIQLQSNMKQQQQQQQHQNTLNSTIKRSMLKTPKEQIGNNVAIRDSIFAQFKDDPIFSELLQTNNFQSKIPVQKGPTGPPPTNNSILNNNINLQRTKTILDSTAKANNEASQNKKKFDDLFNALNNTSIDKPPQNSSIGNKSNKQAGYSDKNFLDDFLLDDENVKPSAKKSSKPGMVAVNSASNMNNGNNLGYESGNLVNNNKRKFFAIS